MISMLLALVLTAEPAKAAPPPQAKAAKAWLAFFRAADPERLIVVDAAPDKQTPNLLNIVVGSQWASIPKGQRLDLATGFWREWADENKANQPAAERCRIALFSPMGRPVGRSGTWGGSDIHVED